MGRPIGVVRVTEDNLIPDGVGGFFVHVTSKDIDRSTVNSYGNIYRPVTTHPNRNYQQNVGRPHWRQINYNFDGFDQGQNGGGHFANRNWRSNNFGDRVSGHVTLKNKRKRNVLIILV